MAQQLEAADRLPDRGQRPLRRIGKATPLDEQEHWRIGGARANGAHLHDRSTAALRIASDMTLADASSP